MSNKRPLKAVVSFLVWVISILLSLAVFGLFLNGTTLTNPILKFIPVVLHAWIGWGLIILVLLGIVLNIIDFFS